MPALGGMRRPGAPYIRIGTEPFDVRPATANARDRGVVLEGETVRHAVARLVAAGAVALALAAAPGGAALAEDYYDGLRAYDSGNFGEAARIWRQAADTGDSKAQLRLGKLYENGEGVERDYVEALRWYILAERNGNQDAAVAAYFLRRNLTEAQQRQATQRAEAWRPRGTGTAQTERQSAEQSRETREIEERQAREREQAERARRAEADRRAAEQRAGRDGDKDPQERNNRDPRTADPHGGDRDTRDEAGPGWLAQAVAGSELRRTLRVEDMTRRDVWRFEPGGRVHGNYTATVNRSGAVYEEDADNGRWRIRQGDLCITWQSWAGGRENCYEVTLLEDGQWRMSHTDSGSDERIVRR